MKTSKQLFKEYIQPLRDAGATYADIAKELGFKSSNLVGMICNADDKAMLSLERLPDLARLCQLTPLQIVHFALARVRDSNGQQLVMGTEAFTFLMRSYATEMFARHGGAVKVRAE